MNRPVKQNFKRPEHIDDYPVGPQYEAGHLAETNAGWRTYRPVVDHDTCINCLRCYLVCPDGTIFKNDGQIGIDYDYCKGCGVCAHECPKDAIEMVKEEL
ncbi:MAG: 4Fe-4S binding protein [Marinilabiliaceae bacterium]|nr:4Fe-4S binding protein [Marinilabiliaceae bacterium]